MDPLETMVPGLTGQKVKGNSAPAVGPIETMVPGLPGQGVNGNSASAVGPRSHGSMSSWAESY